MSSLNIRKLPTAIEPNRCIIEDLEVLAFENEEQLDLYSVWNELLFDKRRELKAESEHERRIIQNEIARKTSHFLFKQADVLPPIAANGFSGNNVRKSSQTTRLQPVATPTTKQNSTPTFQRQQQQQQQQQATPTHKRPIGGTASQQQTSGIKEYGSGLGNGLTIINSLPNSKQLMKYKLTKLYNKYRGRQMRRNFVLERQRNSKIEEYVRKSYLNSWLTYTALQALRLPEPNYTQLSTVTGMNPTKFLAPITSQQQSISVNSNNNYGGVGGDGRIIKRTLKSTKKQSTKQQQQHLQLPQQLLQQQSQPMQLVYMDTSNLITYSNKINPQQVAEYKRKSNILPSSASSKKSSAASYDVYEIMEVLANTNQTNVTISRNSNKNNQNATTTYSHSRNPNVPGIVSTQLHLQAKSYLDSMKKFYIEERQMIEREAERLKNRPSIDELVRHYINVDR